MVVTTAQKWLLGTVGITALYLVLTNPKGVAALAGGIKDVVGGTESVIIRGK